MDLSQIPVLDNHCHFFSTKHNARPLHRMLTLSLNKLPDDQLRHSIIYRKILESLADFLDTSSNEAKVLEAREKAATKDYTTFVRNLMEDVHLSWMLVDIGLQKSSVDFGEFESLVSFPIFYVYRIETVIDRLWRERVPPAEGIKKFREEVQHAVRNLPAIALKSIIGYRTGLEIDPELDAEAADKIGSEAAYRNLFFIEAAKICDEMSIPLHIRAAFGESNLDLRANNPLHLKAFLDSPKAKNIKVVLIHGGYPFAFEAGYLAAMYPNIYVDFSEIVPFVSMGAQRGLEDIMSMCPLNKLIYGSDGFDLPETHWLGAKIAKELLSSTLDNMIADRKINAAYAEEVAHMILYQNSLNLHGLVKEK